MMSCLNGDLEASNDFSRALALASTIMAIFIQGITAVHTLFTRCLYHQRITRTLSVARFLLIIGLLFWVVIIFILSLQGR
jgi:hypothetical protein